jgi:hypothetical protein
VSSAAQTSTDFCGRQERELSDLISLRPDLKKNESGGCLDHGEMVLKSHAVLPQQLGQLALLPRRAAHCKPASKSIARTGQSIRSDVLA